MAKSGAQTIVAFSCAHFPHQNKLAVSVVKKVVKRVKPDKAISLGDLLDCGQFSTHPPTPGVAETDYEDDLTAAIEFLDYIQKHCGYLVLIEGNHEWRIDRWAVKSVVGRGAYRELPPRVRLSRGRKKFTYIPYGSADGQYPHYKLNSRVACVHGWSFAKHATKNHLQKSQGMSIIHGHTHRVDSSIMQNIWERGRIVQAVSAGCLCKPVPLYGTGTPVEWCNAFVIGYLGRKSETLYAVPIQGDRCVLPDGTEIVAGEEGE